MTVSQRSLWGTAVFAALLVLLVWTGWTALSSEPPETAPPPTAVRVETPTVQTVEETVRYLATLEGRHDAPLAFRVSGTIGAVHANEGEAVQQGQVIAELAAPEVQARVERARIELARAEANVDHWKQERAIDRRLYEKGAIPQTKLNQTELTFTNAERQRDAAAASLREARHTADAHVLTAPRDGVIGRLEREAGETVMPGQPVVQLNAGRSRLRIDVLAKDRSRGLRSGSTVRIEASECSTPTGTIEEIETATRPPFESVRVYATVPENCLTDRPMGSTVPVRLVLNRVEDAVLVPQSAIDLRGDQPRIFRVAADSTVDAIPVELGLRTGDDQQVTGALRPNDRIVTTGASNLKPGARVRIDSRAQTQPNR